MRGLAEGGVRRDRQQQPGAAGAARAPRHRSRAARTASRQLSVPPLVSVPTAAGPAAEQGERGAHQVVLDARDAREGGRVEGVGPLERRLRGGRQLLDVRAPRVVDVGHRGAAVGRHVPGLQGGQLGQHVLRASRGVSSGREPVAGEHGHGWRARAAAGTTLKPEPHGEDGGAGLGDHLVAGRGHVAGHGEQAAEQAGADGEAERLRRRPDAGEDAGPALAGRRPRRRRSRRAASPAGTSASRRSRPRPRRRAAPRPRSRRRARPRAAPQPRRTARTRRGGRVRLPTPAADPQPQRHDEDRRRRRGRRTAASRRRVPSTCSE